jgi:hypothetical protein
MREGPDSVYLSDKPIVTIASDRPQGTQATEQKSSDSPKLFDGSDDGRLCGAAVFTGRSGRWLVERRSLRVAVRAAGLRSPLGCVVAFWQ